ncbi:hypothetical protein SNEBB_005182 [Seison nebaliae]|nr:hypothetical protein SNEBB_005182 [Seison nebaliae]
MIYSTIFVDENKSYATTKPKRAFSLFNGIGQNGKKLDPSSTMSFCHPPNENFQRKYRHSSKSATTHRHPLSSYSIIQFNLEDVSQSDRYPTTLPININDQLSYQKTKSTAHNQQNLLLTTNNLFDRQNNNTNKNNSNNNNLENNLERLIQIDDTTSLPTDTLLTENPHSSIFQQSTNFFGKQKKSSRKNTLKKHLANNRHHANIKLSACPQKFVETVQPIDQNNTQPLYESDAVYYDSNLKSNVYGNTSHHTFTTPNNSSKISQKSLSQFHLNRKSPQIYTSYYEKGKYFDSIYGNDITSPVNSLTQHDSYSPSSVDSKTDIRMPSHNTKSSGNHSSSKGQMGSSHSSKNHSASFTNANLPGNGKHRGVASEAYPHISSDRSSSFKMNSHDMKSNMYMMDALRKTITDLEDKLTSETKTNKQLNKKLDEIEKRQRHLADSLSVPLYNQEHQKQQLQYTQATLEWRSNHYDRQLEEFREGLRVQQMQLQAQNNEMLHMKSQLHVLISAVQEIQVRLYQHGAIIRHQVEHLLRQGEDGNVDGGSPTQYKPSKVNNANSRASGPIISEIEDDADTSIKDHKRK